MTSIDKAASPTDEAAPTPLNLVGGHAAHDRYAEMRRGCPVAHEEAFGGYWVLTRYADVSKAARNWRTFRSGKPFVEFPGFALSIPIATNPPEHSSYRRVLNTYFTAERVSALEPQVRRFVDVHVSALLEGGRGDAAAELARPLPVRVLAALLNMPEDAYVDLLARRARVAELSDRPDELNKLLANLWTPKVLELVEERTARPLDPATDLMSGVLAARTREGEPFPREVAIAVGEQIFAAGAGTTTSALTASLHHLATHPEQQAQLRADPDLVPVFVEEALRLYPPLHQLARTTASEMQLHGETIPEGESVALSWAAANRDEDAFEDPEACVLERPRERQHLSFGTGPHQCIGARVARLELRLVLTEVLSRTAGMELEGEPVPEGGVPLKDGYTYLPLRFT